MGDIGLGFALAAVAGVCFALMGVAYRLGQSRRVSPPQILLVTAVVGTAFFAVRAGLGAWQQTPARVIWLGVLAGVTQYAALKLVAAALRSGPLSPVWCAVSLGFVPVIAYAGAALGEPVVGTQYAAVALAVGCVVVASMGQASGGAADQAIRRDGRRQIAYGLLLLVLLVINGVSDVGIKDLGTRADGPGGSYIDRFGSVFLTLLYGCLGGGILLDLLARRSGGTPADGGTAPAEAGEAVSGGRASGEPLLRRSGNERLGRSLAFPERDGGGLAPRAVAQLMRGVPLGCLAALGSIGGLYLTTLCSNQQAAMVFTVRGAASILAASIASVLAFGERLDRRWAGTVSLAVLAIALAAPWGKQVDRAQTGERAEVAGAVAQSQGR